MTLTLSILMNTCSFLDLFVTTLLLKNYESLILKYLKKMSSLQLIIQHKKYGTKLTQNVNDEMFCAGLKGGKGVCTVR